MNKSSRPLLARYLNLLDFSLLSFRRRKLKNGGVFVVFSVTVFFLASFQLLSTGLHHISGELLESVPDITLQQMSAGRQVHLSNDIAASLEEVYGISHKRQRVWGYYFDESNGANYTVVGLEPAALQDGTASLPSLLQGRFPRPGQEGEVVVGAAVQRSLELGERQFFTLFTPELGQKSFKTVGVFSEEVDVLTGDLIIMTIDDARILFGIDSSYMTDMLIDSANPDEVDNMAKKILENNPSLRVVTKNQIRKTYQAVFGWRSGVGSILMLGSMLAFMILAWEKASGLSVEEKREVAILKSIGWQTEDIMIVRFLESFCLSMVAFLFAFVLAWAHLLWFDGSLFRPLLMGWSVLQPSFSIVPVFQLSDVLLVFSLTVIPYWCATVVPIWRGAIVRAEAAV